MFPYYDRYYPYGPFGPFGPYGPYDHYGHHHGHHGGILNNLIVTLRPEYERRHCWDR